MNSVEVEEICIPSYNDTGYYGLEFKRSDIDAFISKLQMVDGDLTGKCLYIQDATLSQNKLRDAGFTITRSKDKADIIVIADFYSLGLTNSWRTRDDSYHFKTITPFEDRLENIKAGYKHVYDRDLYKYLYKYEGNQELYQSIDELCASQDDNNLKLAMEFMVNANWGDNQIYLQQLFSDYWNKMRYHSYKNSISFKGFLESLGFNHESVCLDKGTHYRDLCKNDEHHDFVYNRYKAKFQEELDVLIASYKIKIDKLEFSIDKSILTN